MVVLTYFSISFRWLLLNGSYLYQDLYIHAFEVRIFSTFGVNFLSSKFAVGDLICLMRRHFDAVKVQVPLQIAKNPGNIKHK
jgi:hypothetical protein